MAYEATVFQVMIASPADVQAERGVVREVVYEWNDLHAAAEGLVLLPVGWETHSTPSLAGRAQEIINDTVLAPCDILVGIFWTRLGTPTGDFQSGTAEEIQRHVSSGKPALVYFSTAPIAPDSIDPSQYYALKEFKAWCVQNGLIETFDNKEDFSAKFRRHIQATIRLRREAIAQQAGGQSQQARPELVNGLHLTREAQDLLITASNSSNGLVTHLRHLSGTEIGAGQTSFTRDSSRRNVALWEGAISELLDAKFLVERGNKGEIFEVTHAGYKFAETIQRP